MVASCLDRIEVDFPVVAPCQLCRTTRFFRPASCRQSKNIHTLRFFDSSLAIHFLIHGSSRFAGTMRNRSRWPLRTIFDCLPVVVGHVVPGWSTNLENARGQLHCTALARRPQRTRLLAQHLEVRRFSGCPSFLSSGTQKGESNCERAQQKRQYGDWRSQERTDATGVCAPNQLQMVRR